jgi:hypothetical protein
MGALAIDTDGDGIPDTAGSALIDGFESGNFSANAWTSSPAWLVVSGGAHSGTYYAKQPDLPAQNINSTTYLKLTVAFTYPITLSFY